MPPKTVTASLESRDGTRCIDIFRRNDGGDAGTFGFEEYRRDPEDPRGWAQIGFFGGHVYPTEDEALHAAREAVAWLSGLSRRPS